MKNTSNSEPVFFSFLRGGLWEREVNLTEFDNIDYYSIYQIAQEQSVVGLVAAGMEHLVGVKIPQTLLLEIVGNTLQIEQRNKAMNDFIGVLVGRMHMEGINTVLVKGQGIAQCYIRPLWRASGDVDFLLDTENYAKAKSFFSTISQSVREENTRTLHTAMTISQWDVEIHGTMRGELSERIDRELDIIQADVFSNNHIRNWRSGSIDICLPSVDNDVVYVFTHILQHFFMGGIGLRQVCDWCRLLWTYRSDIDLQLLENRLLDMRVMSEWKAFASLAVEWLGMPADAMPLYSADSCWKRKAERIVSLIMETGNFGHNRDKSFYKKYSFVTYKALSLWRNTWDSMRQFCIFPLDSIRVWWRMVVKGIRVAAKGE